MKSLRAAFAAFITITLFSSAALAADPSGNWKWSVMFNDQSFETGGKFDLKDGKLTGTLESPNGEIAITEGSFKDDTVAFVLSFDGPDGNKFVIKYQGKLEGDTITGKIDFPGFNGDGAQKIDWKATRVKAAKAPEAPAKSK